jgi:hypothetical protein
MRELREYEWISKQEDASIATMAASKSLERDAHVWTEVSLFYIRSVEVGNHTATCRLSQLALWIGTYSEAWGDKLTQMCSELDQLGPFLVPPFLIERPSDRRHVHISISDDIFLSCPRIETSLLHFQYT